MINDYSIGKNYNRCPICLIMKYLNTILFLVVSLSVYCQTDNYMSNTKRGTLQSEILGITKSYQVFLPESYHYADEATYPVIYIVDGDYNFYYQTGIIESLANISEKIPEVIVVGISDNGNEGYRKDCTLKTAGNPNGNAEKFADYIEKELKPVIRKQFKVSSYEILIGHSLGGLFATNVLIKNPSLFSAYIAIDPSYWWDDYDIISRADSLFRDNTDLTSKLFVTLADTKQMGVHQFVGVLEKYFPDSKQWTYKHYEGENHGSVGLLSVRDGLLQIFDRWELSREKFYQLKTAAEVMQHFKDQSALYDSKLRLPPNQLANIIYYYFRNDQMGELKVLEKEISTNFPASIDDYYATLGKYLNEKEKREEAKKILEQSIASNPQAFKSYDALSKLYYAQGDFQKAKDYAERAVNIAKELRARQWQINELESNVEKIKKP